ncbi:MAG: molybdate ABC transporter permease subunit [Gammaproteobacteria bacterium]|nr:molybdate ABC transporter permease subunit [Gammaproteobacteria bacterium]
MLTELPPDLLVELGPTLWLTVQLAAATTLVLFLIGTPFAWWLANTRNVAKPLIEAVTALPLVLPPTVLGFYLLMLMSPDSPVGALWVNVTGQTLVFSFEGLLIASVIYSLPFMVQPLQTAFETIDRQPLEAAASLGASPLDVFVSIACPLAMRGFVSAGILSFAHTIGEFGVVLMVGGSIPGETRVVSIALYEYVETLRFDLAHTLALILVAFALVVLTCVYVFNRRAAVRVG